MRGGFLCGKEQAVRWRAVTIRRWFTTSVVVINYANEIPVITMHNNLADGIDVVFEIFACADDEVLADLVKSLRGD